MMGRLRRKFVLVAMVSVTLVLGGMIAAINVANYINVCSRADERLDLLAQGGGAFPQDMNVDAPVDREVDEQDAGDQSAGDQGAGDQGASDQGAGDQGDDGSRPELRTRTLHSPEMPFETRYFTVVLDEGSAAVSVDTGQIAAVTKEQAVSYARELAQKGSSSGFWDEYRYLAVDMDRSTSSDSSQVMYIFLDCTRDLDSFNSFLAMSVGISALGWLLVLALVVVLSRFAVKPVVEGYEKQKRFVTDASHEIKTPLAVIQASNEVLEIEHGEDEWTKSIRDQVERLGSLTEHLVFLARMDEGTTTLDVDEMSLSAVVEDAAELFRPVAESRGKRISADIASGVECRGDRVAISQLMELLLDNATRYALDGSVIGVRLAQKGRQREIEVSNTCDILPQGDLDRLFERFHRDDSSRSTQTGGSGVGLSVVRAIAEAHGGTARAYRRGEDVIVFTVRL